MAARGAAIEESGQRQPQPVRWSGKRVAVVAVAVVAQMLVLLVTFVLGLVWGGWTYALANLLALAALVAVFFGWPRSRGHGKSWAPLMVPLASGLATALLFQLGTWVEESGACGDTELAAVSELRSPSGSRLDFEGTYDGECIARPGITAPAQQERRHYTDLLVSHGWQIEEASPELVLARRGGVKVAVEVVPAEGMTLVTVWGAAD